MNRYKRSALIYPFLLICFGISGCLVESGPPTSQGTVIMEPVDTPIVGQTDAAAASDEDGAETPMNQEPDENSDTEQTEFTMPMTSYHHDTLPIAFSYPQNFTIRTIGEERLALLEPTPIAGLRLLNPDAAASALGDMEIADLELRIYQNPANATLEDWLKANGFIPADGAPPLKPFTEEYISGIEVCSTLLVAPGCSYFAASGAYLYEMIPASLEGEAILQTVQLD